MHIRLSVEAEEADQLELDSGFQPLSNDDSHEP